LLEAGAIHRAHGGVLFIDEVSTLSLESQQSLLTAIQEKQMPILGRSPGSSGTMVCSEAVPCEFLLIVAGNLDDIEKMHPALRSRLRGYGYEILTNDTIPASATNTSQMVQFIAQEVQRDGRIPHVRTDGIEAILDEAKRRSGSDGTYTARFRELGGLIRIAGDLARQDDAAFIEALHVERAREFARSLEEQLADAPVSLQIQERAS
jgi:Lon-like ATP-dependent protease